MCNDLSIMDANGIPDLAIGVSGHELFRVFHEML